MNEYPTLENKFLTNNITAVQKYIDTLSFPLKVSVVGKNSIVFNKNEPLSILNNSDLYVSNNNNRVAIGLRSLELLNLLCRGISSNDLYLYSNIRTYTSVAEVLSSTDEEMFNIVVLHLGLTAIYNSVKNNASQNVKYFENMIKRIGIDVKGGIFKYEDYRISVQRLARELLLLINRQ